MKKLTQAQKYSHINIADFSKVENFEDSTLKLVKVHNNLWLLVDSKGDLVTLAKTKSAIIKLAVSAWKSIQEQAKKLTKKRTTKKPVVKVAKKRAVKRLVTGNVMKFGFGQKISSTQVKQYLKSAWKGVFKLVEADIVNGYWGGTVLHTATGEKFYVVRMDYVINYIRAPKGTETLEDVRAVMVERGVASR